MLKRTIRFGVVVLMATACAAGGCTTNAATGGTHLMLLSRDQEVQIGAEAAPQFTEEFGGAVGDPALAAYVDRVGASMSARTEAYFPQLGWEFTLLDSDVTNAFALPGGRVFITRGLAEQLTSEAQLAGVLGHEIGHVTAQHANRRISKQMGMNIMLAGMTAVVAASDEDSDLGKYGRLAVPALAVGGNLILLKYGRDEELEADRLGMRYMASAGYDPSGQLEVMYVLAGLGGGERPPEILSSHPEPERRMVQVRRILDTVYAGGAPVRGDGRFEARFEEEFLVRLYALPAPRHGAQAALGMRGPIAPWCATCAGR